MLLVPDSVPLSAFWPFLCWSVPHNCGLTPYGSCWGNTRVQSRTNEGFQTLTRSGIPTIIPSFHRRAIKDRRDPRLVKFYCSLFSLSNIILVWPSGIMIPPTTIHVKSRGQLVLRFSRHLWCLRLRYSWLIALVIPDCLFNEAFGIDLPGLPVPTPTRTR